MEKSDMFNAIRFSNVELLHQAIQNGANVNAPRSGNTPLAYACGYNDLKIIRLLLNYGADVNGRGKNGCTPLENACYKGSEDIVRLLIEHGADPNARDDNGRTPLHRACWPGYAGIVHILLESGADASGHRDFLSLACMEGWGKIVGSLLDYGAGVNAKDPDGNTPLHYACDSGHPDVVRLLINRQADVHIVNHAGKLAIDLVLELLPHDPDKEEILEIFREHAPELYFAKFCTTAPGPGGR